MPLVPAVLRITHNYITSATSRSCLFLPPYLINFPIMFSIFDENVLKYYSFDELDKKMDSYLKIVRDQ